MLQVKAARRDRSNIDVKDSTWNQSFFNSLSSQIKSNYIPSEINLMMLIKQILIHISPFAAAIAVKKYWKSQ